MDLSSFLASVSDNAANLDGAGVTLWSSFLGFVTLFIAGASLTRRVGKKAKLEDVSGAWGIAFLWGLTFGVMTMVILLVHRELHMNLWGTAFGVIGTCTLLFFTAKWLIALEGRNSTIEQQSDDDAL